ncbi:hypothetical protein QVD17_08803 [Tagetes erecta]|uniref:Uncharacterized protein n=1 Tax=Tagetes erecta TaxID=13708 RepID=A0AAD8NXS9_TARER|nr:hypothetical protein QVD17_08803 [Tagetes erecta]
MPDTDIAEVEFVESMLVFSEDDEAGSEDEHTEEVQAETIVLDMPDTDIAEAEFVESMLVFSEDDEAGSEDVTNLLAGIESRAGAYNENL